MSGPQSQQFLSGVVLICGFVVVGINTGIDNIEIKLVDVCGTR